MKNKFYEFCNPVKVISGENSIENIPYEVKQLGAKNPLIVTEENIYNLGMLILLLNV